MYKTTIVTIGENKALEHLYQVIQTVIATTENAPEYEQL